MAAAPASAYKFFPPKLVYFEIKPETVKAIAKAIEKTANRQLQVFENQII